MNCKQRMTRLFVSITVFCASSAALADGELAFQGTCHLTGRSGGSQLIDSFSLSHADALAGNCPGKEIRFTETGSDGTLSEYVVYVEHQREYAGIYLSKGERQLAHVAVNNVVIGPTVSFGERISPDIYLSCEGELK